MGRGRRCIKGRECERDPAGGVVESDGEAARQEHVRDREQWR